VFVARYSHPPLLDQSVHPLLQRLAEQHLVTAQPERVAAFLAAASEAFHTLQREHAPDPADEEGQFRMLADTVAAATFIYSGEGFVWVNAAAAEMTGYSRDELLSMHFWDVVHPEHRQMIRDRGLARQRGEDVPNRYTFKIIRRDGEERWVDFTAGRIVHRGEWAALGTAFDITEAKRLETELERQALAFENLYDAIIISDLSGKITDWNPAAEAIYGYRQEEVLGKTVEDLFIHGSEARLTERILEGLDTRGRWQGEIRFVRRDGTTGVSETVVLPLLDTRGKRVGALGVNRDITEKKRAEEALRASEERFRLMVAGSEQVFFYVHDTEGVYEYITPSLFHVLGYDPEELVGQRYEMLHDPQTDGPEVDRQTAVTLATGGAPNTYVVHARHRKGHLVALELVETAVRRGGQITGVQGFARDVTERTRAVEALRESEERYRTLFEESRDAVYITTLDGRFEAANQAAVELFGYTREELLQLNVEDLYVDVSDRGRFRDQIFRAGYVRDFEVRLQRRDGRMIHCLLSATLRRSADDTVTGFQGILHDITERKRVEEQLAYGALHDALTGLPNRALFVDRLGRAAARVKRQGEGAVAVLFLDLDRFKVVNDSLGHAVGDRMLVAIGERLGRAAPPGTTVSRFGGDEFTVLLEGVANPVDATHVAEELLRALGTPFVLGGQEVFASASLGIALGDGHEAPDELLRNADAALSRAKARGKNRYEVFDRAMHAEAMERLRLETDLRRALERGELRLAYQPIIQLQEGRLSGFEALLRWEHPERGMVAPAAFIPLAEETGQIVAVGRWVLEEACRTLAAWNRLWPERGLTMSVNLSARQFSQGGLAEFVLQTMEGQGISPPSIHLEITESILLEHAEPAGTELRRLRELGVGLSMDDFGTGYSSLGYLHRFALDELKIDRTFVGRMESDARSAQLVEAIVALAQTLGVRVVAEGVERVTQMESLRVLGCEYAQGFYFAQPLFPADAVRLLEQDPRW
jgi:diguanylate cyclase (GGDEF)-like protein/PAS domain S-box-containing protein